MTGSIGTVSDSGEISRSTASARDRGSYFAFVRAQTAIAELDGLRAFAIILVVMRHGLRPFRDEEGALLSVGGWHLDAVLVNGWIGVDLFFVLSGFLIAHHLCRRSSAEPGGLGLGRYFLRRILRIVPLYYAVLAIVALGLMPGYLVSEEGLAARVGYHLLFMQDYLRSDIVVVFWSLGVEEKFYIAAPFLLAAIWKLRAPRMQYAALVGLALCAPAIRAATYLADPFTGSYEAFFTDYRSPFHMCFEALVAGVLCALLYRNLKASGDATPLGIWLFWAGTAVIAAVAMRGELLAEIGFFEIVFLQTVLAAGFAAILLGAVLGGAPGFLKGLAFLFVSRISYSLYLIHLPLIPLSFALSRALFDSPSATPLAQFSIFLPIYLSLSIIVALVLHYTVEKPFLVLKDRI